MLLIRRSFAITLGLAFTFLAGASRAQTPSAPPASPADDSDVIEVDGVIRSLPRAVVVPTDDASVSASKEVARLVGITGLFATSVLKPNAAAGGYVVRVTAATEGSGQRIDAVSSGLQGGTHRRSVVVQPDDGALQTARLADAVLEDLTGTRSHLSGTLLFTDASVVGERRVRVMLASGANARDVSPAGMFARGADVGAGNVIYYAAAREGEPMRIYAEGRGEPVAVRVPGFLQAVSFTPDRLRAVVVAGVANGGTLFRGLLEGRMEPVAIGNGIAFGPTFGPNGELAYAAGPEKGPLRVYVDGRPISVAGSWASGPSFCNKQDHRRIAYAVRQGASSVIAITDLSGGGQMVGEGAAPACSPDGRSLALVRGSAKGGGIFVVGEDGIAAHRIRVGAAADLRWAPGPSLPPEG